LSQDDLISHLAVGGGGGRESTAVLISPTSSTGLLFQSPKDQTVPGAIEDHQTENGNIYLQWSIHE
jgi:hypothetical protein